MLKMNKKVNHSGKSTVSSVAKKNVKIKSNVKISEDKKVNKPGKSTLSSVAKKNVKIKSNVKISEDKKVYKPGKSTLPSVAKKNVKIKSKVKISKTEELPRTVVKKVNRKRTGEKLIKPPTMKVPCQDNISRLYIKLKKPIERSYKTLDELIALHPNIKNVRLPRRGIRAKFFFAHFDSKQSALIAMEDLKKKENCFVKLVVGKSSRSKLQQKTVRKKKILESWAI